MTTKLAYQYLTEIDYASLEFNPDEPAPRPDAMYQNPIIYPAVSVLSAHFGADYRQNDVFIDVSTFICYDPSNLNVRISPDIYIAFGVETLAIERRKLYLPWEVGKPPDFVLEVGSESTAPEDVARKPGIYAQIGVPEYWRFDRSGGDLYGDPLLGGELVDGAYRQVELTTEPDGTLKGYSPILGLYLCWSDGWLQFYNPATGEYLQDLPQTREVLREEREARQMAEGDLLLERAARQADQEARQRAEARLLQLEEELRRREEGR